MVKSMFCVRDDVSEIFNDPFYEVNEAFAKRRFQVMMRTLPDGVYPGEFSLWSVGLFDDHKGIVECPEPYMVMRGVNDGE